MGFCLALSDFDWDVLSWGLHYDRTLNADLLRVIPLGPAVRCGASRG